MANRGGSSQEACEDEMILTRGCRFETIVLMVALDDIDRQMIALLQREGRISMPAAAERLGIGRATAYNRFDRHTAIGLDVAALLLINVRQHEWRDVQDALMELDGVEWFGLATGAYDFVILVRAPSLEHLRDVVLLDIQRIDGVRSAQTVVLLDEVDRRGESG